MQIKFKIFPLIGIAILLCLPAVLLLGGCGAGGVKPIEDSQSQFKRAMELFNKKKYYEAETEFQRFIYNFPGNTAVDTAQYYLAMCYFDDNDYALAGGEFKKLLTSFPASAFADDAQYRLAMSHYHQSPNYYLDQTDTYIAIEEFLNFLDKYAISEFSDSANFYLKEMRNKLARKTFKAGELYQKLNEYDPAVLYYDRVLDDYADSPFSEEALYHKGECLISLKKDIRARDAFLEYIDKYENGKFHKDATNKLRILEDKPQAKK